MSQTRKEAKIARKGTQKVRTMADSAGAGETAPPERVVFGKYALGRLLGRGASARVYLARDLSSGHSFAIKVFPKPRPCSAAAASSSSSAAAARDDGSTAVLREISALRRLRHPHIVRLHEVLASRSKVYLVLELAKGGELFSRLNDAGRLPEDQSRRLFRQLLSAVAFSHSRGVFHRDLKPENLLLDEAGDLKVSDFGLSAIHSTSAAAADGHLFHTLCGTPAYVAPEILSKKGYDGRKVDMWSAGVILFVLNAGYLPFNDPNLMAMYRKIYRGQFRCPRWTSPELRRLLGRMLDPNPETRITVDDVVRDPWFRKGGFDAEKWTAMMRPRVDHDAKIEDRTAHLNAFDIISFSSGLDLSGLLEPGLTRETFASTGPPEALLERVEEVGRKEGLAVRKKANKNGFNATVEGQSGNYVVRIEVYRVADGAAMVEVQAEKEAASASASAAAAEVVRFWKEKLSPQRR